MEQVNKQKTIISECIDLIKVAAKMSGNFIVYEEETHQGLYNEIENVTLKKIILCSEVIDSRIPYYEREKGYGRLIFRFYEDKHGNFIKMSVCDRDGMLSADIDESIEILGKYL